MVMTRKQSIGLFLRILWDNMKDGIGKWRKGDFNG